MKQFLLFAGTADNPAGGMHGFAGDFDSIAEAFLGLVDLRSLRNGGTFSTPRPEKSSRVSISRRRRE